MAWTPKSLLALGLALAVFMTPDCGLAQLGGGPAAKPEVLLLLEGSEAWEYRSSPAGTWPNCNACINSGNPNLCRTYGIVLKEILTGTFDDQTMTCDDRQLPANRPDFGTSPEHFLVIDETQSTPDGFLDSLRDDVKFGLMTGDHAELSTQLLEGEFSYGPVTSCVWDDGSGPQAVTINLGAKGEWASYGARVSIEPDDDLASVRATNATVQDAIVSDVPWGGFHAAALFDDAYQYLLTDPHFQPFDAASNPQGDPYASCRSRGVILITRSPVDDTYVDSAAGCIPSYAERVVNIATDLGIPVYVVTFDADTGARAEADAMAMLGGTDAAYHAGTTSGVRLYLSTIIDELSEWGVGLVAPIATTATRSPSDAMYEFYVGYTRTLGKLDPVGILSSLIWRCQDCVDFLADVGPEPCETNSISDRLRDRADSTRTVFTQLDGIKTSFDAASITADDLDIPTSGDLIDIRPDSPCTQDMYWDDSNVLGNAAQATVRATYRDALLGFIRGDELSRRCDRPFGAVEHGAPVSIGAPGLNISAYGYGLFKIEDDANPGERAVANRPTMLYTHTHAGVVHGFRVDRPTSLAESDYDEELWAYVPGMLLPRLQEVPYSFDFLLDGHMIVKDVPVKRELDMTDEEVAENWKTVLIGTCGSGCRGIYALDVTEPEEPRFMWEISPGQRCYNNPEEMSGCVATNEYDRLGYTISKPELGVVFSTTYLGSVEAQERGVVIVGGGDDTGVPGNPDHIAESVFVLDLLTGRVVKEFNNVDAPSAVTPVAKLSAPVIGDVAGYNTFPGRIMSKAFVGDAVGQIWRLDVSHPDVAEWTMDLFYDTFVETGGLASPPIKDAPALAMDDGFAGLIVSFTSGGTRYITDTSVQHVAAAVREAFNYDTGLPILEPDPIWTHLFLPSEIPTNRPIIYNGVSYFSTYIHDSANVCNVGDSRVYGVTYNDDNGAGGFEGALEADDAVSNLYVPFDDTVIVGIYLVLRPSCIGEVPSTYRGEDGGTPAAGSFSQAPASIVGATGPGSASSPGQTPSGAPDAAPIGSVDVKLQGAPSNVILSTWGLVFE